MVERACKRPLIPDIGGKGRKAAGTASKFSKKRLSFNTEKNVFLSTLGISFSQTLNPPCPPSPPPSYSSTRRIDTVCSEAC